MNPRHLHLIFDFDGTIVDSAPAILACFRDVLAHRGITPLIKLDRTLIGPPLLETLQLMTGIPDKVELQGLADDFKRRYDQEALFHTMAYPEVGNALVELVASGRCLHIATNKRLHPTRLILRHLGFEEHFASVYAIDRCDPPYRNKSAILAAQLSEQGIAAHQACYVGDKAEDGNAADANGLAFYFVHWGYGATESGAAAVLPEHWRQVREVAQLPASLLAPPGTLL